ncbi:MAG: hypothetical protein HC903_16825 [Methylacidiphilales bacterium]|nr:hypothetical protein [Candidatus Methylacidiphilales bacterium]NJR18685.1 hypothetical protein [Calothrix sp. CSU_2_0]
MITNLHRSTTPMILKGSNFCEYLFFSDGAKHPAIAEHRLEIWDNGHDS